MKLFGHDTSPYVRRIRVLLQELGLPFQRDTQSAMAPTPALLHLNPMLRVPVLLDDDEDEQERGQALLDSRLIAGYLYERYPQGRSSAPLPPGVLPLQPTLFRPGHRYYDENILLIIDAATDSAINVFLLELDGVDRAAAPYLQRQMERVATCMSWLDKRFAGRHSLADDALSYTDVALCCTLDWMEFRKRYEITHHQHLMRLRARHQDRPSLATTHPRLAQNLGPPVVPRPTPR